MVELVEKTADCISLLEWQLIINNIDYKIVKSNKSLGIPEPYLIVDGVPLDLYRALEWIQEVKHGNSTRLVRK